MTMIYNKKEILKNLRNSSYIRIETTNECFVFDDVKFADYELEETPDYDILYLKIWYVDADDISVKWIDMNHVISIETTNEIDFPNSSKEVN